MSVQAVVPAAAVGTPDPKPTTTTSTKQPSTFTGFMIGAVAACGAVTITNPPELVKTRLQLLGEGGKAHAMEHASATPPKSFELYRKSPFQILATLYKHEGVRGIQRGLSAAYVYQILLNGTRLGLFEPVRQGLSKGGFTPYFASLTSGAICGAVGAAVASPLFLIKTRMQSFSTAFPVGTQHSYVKDGFLRAFAEIYRTEGAARIFKGVEVGVMRTAAGSAVQLSTYTTLKKTLAPYVGGEDTLLNNVTASLITGFAVAATMNPFDVVYNRVLNADPSKPYKNSVECLVHTVRDEGPGALAKGYVAHYLRIGPHGLVTLVLMDQLRALWVRWNS